MDVSSRFVGFSSPGPRARILLVEPHEDTRELMSLYLVHMGWSVSIALTSDAAILLAAHVDAVITGVGLRGSMDGIELVRRIRQTYREQPKPVIVFTAYAFASYRVRALEAGANVFLAKPSPPEDLVAALRRLLPGVASTAPAPERAAAARRNATTSVARA